MEPKKNPKADLSRNSSLYFAIGLALVTFLVWRGLEYKKYDDDSLYDFTQQVDDLLDEEVPMTQQLKTPPPPPPPAAPEVIEVVEDEVEIEETVIESTEVDQETEIVEVEEIEVEAMEEDIDVPFSVIENVPIFPGCEKGNNSQKRDCMSKKISQFVNKKFNTELASDLGLSGRQRINVIFKISKTGDITGIRARAPHPGLEKEAARVIGLLPKMKPGKQRGKPVNVPYSLPIIFQVQD